MSELLKTLPPLTRNLVIDLGEDIDGNPQKITLAWKVGALSKENFPRFNALTEEFKEDERRRLNEALADAEAAQEAALEKVDGKKPKAKKGEAQPSPVDVDRYVELYEGLDRLRAEMKALEEQGGELPRTPEQIARKWAILERNVVIATVSKPKTPEQLEAEAEERKRVADAEQASEERQIDFVAKQLDHLCHRLKINNEPSEEATADRFKELLNLSGLAEARNAILAEMNAPLGIASRTATS